MDTKTLCLNLVKSNSSLEVIETLREVGYWDDDSVWQIYGAVESNWGTGNTQQDKPEAALVEKIVNSIDAVLMRECLLQDISPVDVKQAPQSIPEAVELFFRIRSGALENMLDRNRVQLAEQIKLVATGTKENTCLEIIDLGEGQTPNEFPNTFVSLHRSNKANIPFVQGKYCMGGTGVIPFSGEHGLQLIISRRHPQIATIEAEKRIVKGERPDPTRNDWGFTIVRLFPPTSNMKNFIIKYLAPNGNVLRFESSSLEIQPNSYPDPSGNDMEWGTLVKLYDYDLPDRLKQHIRMRLFFRLSFLLPRIALPVRMYERREGFERSEKHENTLSGLAVRLEEDRTQRLEAGFPCSGQITVAGTQLNCSIYVFTKGPTDAYVQNEGVAFILDGQTQGWFDRTMFTTDSVRLGYISKSLLVFVDCNNLPRLVSAKTFMGSRDRLRINKTTREIYDAIVEMLREHPALAEINNRRMREDMAEKLKDTKSIEDALREIMKWSPGISFLFQPGEKDLPKPYAPIGVGTQDVWKGKIFPDLWKLKMKPKREVPLGNVCRVFYETDAVNDYFERHVDPGKFTLILEGGLPKSTFNLWNGIATLTLSLPKDAKEGDIFRYKSRVTDRWHELNPWDDEFELMVVEAAKKKEKGSGKRAKPPSNEEGNQRHMPDSLDLPPIVEIRQKDWNDEYNEYSALKVVPSVDKYVFYINMDNTFLQNEAKRRGKRGSGKAEIEAQYRFAMVLIGMALLNKDSRVAMELPEDLPVVELIPVITRAISPMIVSIMNDFR